MEIAILMTLRAFGERVLPVQRKLCGLVIEAESCLAPFPTRSRVAGLAGALEFGVLECAFMGIHMTALAVCVGEALVLGLCHSGFGSMTLVARQILVQSGERERCPKVTEPRRRFPHFLRMAA